MQYLLQRFENIFMLYVVQRLNELQDLTPVNGFIELSDDTSAITVKILMRQTFDLITSWKLKQLSRLW